MLNDLSALLPLLIVLGLPGYFMFRTGARRQAVITRLDERTAAWHEKSRQLDWVATALEQKPR